MSSSKIALITGITGQDGSYLSELLLKKGYKVYGIIQRHSNPNYENLEFFGKGDLKSNLKLNSYMPILRTITSGHVGFAESYLKGEWTSSDLESLLEIMVTNLPEAFSAKSKIHLTYNRIIHFFRENTKSRAKKNIQYHYASLQS